MRRLLFVAVLLIVLLPATVRAGSPPASAIRFSHPLLAPGAAETVTVTARDLSGLPLAGAHVQLVEHLATRTAHIHMKPTNHLGLTSVVLHPSKSLKGTQVLVQATITTRTLTVPVTASFKIMSTPPPAAGSSPTVTPAPTRTPTRTPVPASASTGPLVVTAQAVPASVQAPSPIWLVVQVRSGSGENLSGVPVQATGSFAEGLTPAQGTTDSGGVATLRIDTALARANETVHVTASASWHGQTAFGLADVTVVVPTTPTPTATPPGAPVPTPTSMPTGTPAAATATAPPTITAVPTDLPTLTPIPTSTPQPTAVPSPTLPSSCNGQSCMDAMMTILNNTRAQYGLPPLSLDPTQSSGTSTCVGSIGHSEAMAASGQIWHVNPAYPAASFPTNNCYYGHLNSPPVGQNVGMMGSGNEMSDLVGINNLMMSEQHDATYCTQYQNHACAILSQVYTRVGLGIYYSGGATWLTEDFIG